MSSRRVLAISVVSLVFSLAILGVGVRRVVKNHDLVTRKQVQELMAAEIVARKNPCKPNWDYIAGQCSVIVPGEMVSINPQIACQFVESEYKTLCVYDPKDPPN